MVFFSDPSYSYNGTLEYYNYMRGKLPIPKYPSGVSFPSSIAITTATGAYFYPGDPVTGNGLIDGTVDGPSERRIWLITGPFTMHLNDTVQTVIALVVGKDNDNLKCITKMKQNDIAAQKTFDNLFKLPTLPFPKVEVVPLHKKLVLNWDSDLGNNKLIETFIEDGYNFEGYEIYQLPNKISNIDEGVKLGQFDLINKVTAIYDTLRDENWITIPKLQISGKDNGISRFIVISRDSLRQLELFDGQKYYFTVVPYAYNKNPIFQKHIIRSPLKVITAVPQKANPGIRYNSTFGDTLLSYHVAGKGYGKILPIVIDPTQTDGKTYQVVFDTLNNEVVWHLKEKISEKIILTNQTNQSGDNDYPIINGVMPKVIGNPLGIKKVEFPYDRWINGYNWNGNDELKGIDIGKAFWEEAAPIIYYVLIEIRFTGGVGTENPTIENGWSQGAVYRKDKNYEYSGIGWMPFTAWDVSDSLNPRQVNVSFVEDSIVGNTNLKWDLGRTDNRNLHLGGNEYIIISNTDYNPSYYNQDNNALVNNNMYFIWSRYRREYLLNPFTIKIIPNEINLPGDIYEYTTPEVVIDKILAKKDVEKINVFPNPCYTTNPNGYVTFNHLPDKAKIRIFDLSGVLVKTIKHEGKENQFERWYLNSNNNIAIASGIYIVQIDMPELNKIKILKLAIVNKY